MLTAPALGVHILVCPEVNIGRTLVLFRVSSGEIAFFPVSATKPIAKIFGLGRSSSVAGGVRKSGLGLIGKCSSVLRTFRWGVAFNFVVVDYVYRWSKKRRGRFIFICHETIKLECFSDLLLTVVFPKYHAFVFLHCTWR